MSVEDGIPEEGQATEATQDWEKDYKALQAEYTRSQQALKEQQGVWDDEEAVMQRFAEKFPHRLVSDDEEETEDIYEPGEEDRPLTKAEFEEYKREQAQAIQRQSAQQQFETDFKTFVNERELSPQGERAIRSTPGLNSPDDLKKAVDDWFTYEDGLKAAAKPKPRAPHVPANGQSATDVPNWDEMTPGDINRYMVERVQAESAQT